MRSLCSFVLMIFMLFLVTPTLVGMIEKSSDTSVFFSLTEEEITHKHIESEFRFEEPFIPILISTQNKGPILSPQNLRHDSVAATIVIPPPEV